MPKTLLHFEVRDRLPTIPGSDGHVLPIAWITSNRCLDTATVLRDDVFDKCEIAFLDLMRFHLINELHLCMQILSNNYESGSISIQAMYNPWS